MELQAWENPETLRMSQQVQGFLDILKVDWSKIDKARMKSGIDSCIEALKPATTLPGNIDDIGWDMLKNAVLSYIDKIAGTNTDPHITVGDPNYTAADVDGYLNHLGAGTGPDMETVRQKLRNRPNTLNTLKKNFTEEEQRKIVGNPLWISLLTIFGPMVIDLIKYLLSK